MATLPLETIDGFVKAALVLARSAEYVLVTRAVAEAVKEPLSSSKVQIMRLLSQRGAQTSTQIARYLGVTKPAVSQIIDAMVTRKLVSRKPGKRDRREIGLTLSEQGKRVMTAIRRQQRQAVRAALRGTGAGSVRQWIKAAEQMAAAMTSADNAHEQFCAQCSGHEDASCVLGSGNTDCVFLDHEAKLLARHERAKSRAAG